MLSELVSASGVQIDTFSQVQANLKYIIFISTMDSINRKMSKESIKLASEGFKSPWKMRQEIKSPSYSTKCNEIAQAN